MLSRNKKLRYYYWLVLEFTRKNARLILLSFLLSIFSIISIISLSPYLINYTTAQRTIVGMVGTYELTNLPDEIMSNISNGLIYINEKGEIVPILAQSWEQIDNGKEYRFHLKKNLYWNDGSKFTAQQINYSFKDVQVQAINDYTIVFKLKNPLPIFPTYLTTPIIKDRLTGVAGLYKVDRIKSKYGIVKELYLAPNRDELPILVYKFFDSETKLIDSYKLGEINQMMITKKTVADAFTNWKNTEITKSIDHSRLLTLFFNMDKELLKEKDLRQAVAMSIDKQEILELGEEAVGPIPPFSWAYNPLLKKTQYNPDLAKKILGKYTEGSASASITIDTYYDYLDIAETIKESIERTGVKVKLNTLTLEQPAGYDLLLAYWKVPLDPDQYYFWHSTQTQGNITHLKNVKIDKLLEDGRNKLNIGERTKIYHNFQKVIVDEVPAYFLFYPYVYTVKRK